MQPDWTGALIDRSVRGPLFAGDPAKRSGTCARAACWL